MAALQPLSSVRYGNFSFPASAKADVDTAFAYLSQDSVERSLIDKLEHGSRTYQLVITHNGSDSFHPDDDTIHWDPHSALRTTDGGTQSPALGLGHEIDHAVEDPATGARLARTPDPDYDNAEEKRVITGSETHAARTLGEGIRHDHGGTAYDVSSPIDRRA